MTASKKKTTVSPISPDAAVNAPPRASLFPIVGIGASAGALEALELFLRHVPKSSGMAFVIVQHLSPTHIGNLPELLQRATTMKVLQVNESVRVKPDCVYVIPPNKEMMISNRILHLQVPEAKQGLRLPIDTFLRSLAADCGEQSIGVILSGMGSDGGQSEMDYPGNTIPPGVYLLMEVTDSGCGLDEESMRRVFEPFYTTKSTGRGLGMSAVLGVISAHKGALQLVSKPGQGATFKVYLPAQHCIAAEEEAVPQGAEKPWKGSGTILLAEDEIQVTETVKVML